MGQFGFPLTGTETRCYTNHALSYDQSKRVPRWVLEHISKSKIVGRWLEVKASLEGVSRCRTRGVSDPLNLFHVTARLEDDVHVAHWINGPRLAVREYQTLPSCFRAEGTHMLTHKYVISIAAISNIHSLSPQLLLVCLTRLNLGDIGVTMAL